MADTPQDVINRLSPEKVARIRQLAAEGMTASWIAEDVGIDNRSARLVASTVPGGKERLAEWYSAFAWIRRRPTVMALHQEFTPAGAGR